ncbi:maltodextrose utilization protein MalA family protein [Streptococcus sp. oral taxon 056 str. F0418]|nr:maltodextrose utilization protein MalA family protein [Streptococcus sp. oral taxon 056 str. F0418]
MTLYFDKEQLLISKHNKKLASIRYQAINQEALRSKQSLSAAISKDWFQQNRLIISLFLLLVSGLLLSFNFFILTFGASLFLYLTKKSRLFSFTTFKECYNFTLNCLGLPTLIAVFFGILGQPLTTMIMIQNILFVLYLVIAFYRTHFREENEEN